MSAGRAGYDAMVALEQDAARYRLLREEGRDLQELLKLIVRINATQDGTSIVALRHTHYLDAAIDAEMADEPRYTITPAGREHLDGKA